jgi:hypothetical protein
VASKLPGETAMTNWMRWMLCVACLATVGLLWHVGALSAVPALATGAASLLLFAWPAHGQRKRRTALQYIKMGKQPIGLH